MTSLNGEITETQALVFIIMGLSLIVLGAIFSFTISFGFMGLFAAGAVFFAIGVSTRMNAESPHNPSKV